MLLEDLRVEEVRKKLQVAYISRLLPYLSSLYHGPPVVPNVVMYFVEPMNDSDSCEFDGREVRTRDRTQGVM